MRSDSCSSRWAPSAQKRRQVRLLPVHLRRPRLHPRCRAFRRTIRRFRRASRTAPCGPTAASRVRLPTARSPARISASLASPRRSSACALKQGKGSDSVILVERWAEERDTQSRRTLVGAPIPRHQSDRTDETQTTNLILRSIAQRCVSKDGSRRPLRGLLTMRRFQFHNLILRSIAQRCVSKDGCNHGLACGRPSRRAQERAPQDEVCQ